MIRARGSILLVLYSMIILEPAIFYIMVVVRYNHTLVYNSPSCVLSLSSLNKTHIFKLVDEMLVSIQLY